MDSFRAFSITHALAVATLALLIVVWIAATRKAPASAGPSAVERALAWINLAIWFAAHLWWIIPPALDVRTTLPLQLCHVAAILASVVLLTRRRWARTLVYFWGIGLSTQAILTPSLTDPPDSIWFWGFWQQHGFRLACLATCAYLLAILPLNLLLGANYGFVGDSTPETPSIVDVLGPWPQRLVIIIALVFVAFLILKLLGGGWRRLPGHR
ncbi:MAG: TIGR02206 family membrane protein [Burkholderiales bacterium]